MTISINEEIFRKVLNKHFPLQYAYYPPPAADLIHKLGTNNSYNPSENQEDAAALGQLLGLYTPNRGLHTDGNHWFIRDTVEGTMETTIYSGPTAQAAICKALLEIYGKRE